MEFTTIFFDVDDTLYPPSSGLWHEIRKRIELYMHERLNVPVEDVPALRKKLYEQYGTTLKGLEQNFEFERRDFLAYVHDIPLRNYIQPNEKLRAVLQSLSPKKFIFTNADEAHAARVLDALNVRDLFNGVIDTNKMFPHCKPERPAFELALSISGEPDPHKCVMIDDLAWTTQAAKEFGMFAILAGGDKNNGSADAVMNDWGELINILRIRELEIRD